MKIFITGVCGYVGSTIAAYLAKSLSGAEIFGMDNLSRRGSEINLPVLKKYGIRFCHGDLRLESDLNSVSKADWVIDCAANPSVLAGTGLPCLASSRQLIENNLLGTFNILEYCKKNRSGLVILSTSRVYSVGELLKIKLKETPIRFAPVFPATVRGFSEFGVSEEFSTMPPVSFYGASKLSSEIMALEYGNAFGFQVWINRCGVIAGPGQFGKVDQGIFSFWAYYFVLNRPLKYIGFGGRGKQVRDCVAGEDVAELVLKQIKNPDKKCGKIINVGGGKENSMSLKEINSFCEKFFRCKNKVDSEQENRPYDVPYFVADIRLVWKLWNWKPARRVEQIMSKICQWAVKNKDKLKSWL